MAKILAKAGENGRRLRRWGRRKGLNFLGDETFL